jgi:hypothetical protein
MLEDALMCPFYTTRDRFCILRRMVEETGVPVVVQEVINDNESS